MERSSSANALMKSAASSVCGSVSVSDPERGEGEERVRDIEKKGVETLGGKKTPNPHPPCLTPSTGPNYTHLYFTLSFFVLSPPLSPTFIHLLPLSSRTQRVAQTALSPFFKHDSESYICSQSKDSSKNILRFLFMFKITL